MKKNIGRAKFVKKARQEHAWPQSQLAEIAGVNLRTIQRLEKDGVGSFETLKGVASAFDIDVKELIQISTPEEKVEHPKKVYFLNWIASGKNLTDVITGADQFVIEHDNEANDPRAINAMKDILVLLKGDVVRLYDADPVERLKVEAEMTREIKFLESYGFYLFGIKRIIPRIVENQKTEIVMCTLYMSHAQSRKIIKDKNSMVIPATLIEVVQG